MNLKSAHSCVKLVTLLISFENLACATGMPSIQSLDLIASNTSIVNQENIMTTEEQPVRSSSRIAAPKVGPITYNGVRYEQLTAPSSEGLPPGGYVVATEIASGTRLKIIKVYDTVIDPNRESDVQNVFFKKMELDERGDALLIEDEKRRKYRIDLKSGEVQEESKPERLSFFKKIRGVFNSGA